MIAKSVTKTYKNKCVLDLPQLTFEKGKRYALIGSNGSGKSTYAKILAGTLESDQGKSVLSEDIKIGYAPQKSYAFRMSLRKNILLGKGDPERAEALMKALGIEALAEQNAKGLSGGETARMTLARVLMDAHELLILDEPTAAMDIESTLMAEELILEYCEETGCILILITHSLQQAQRLADEVLFLDHGQLVEAGPAERVLHAPKEGKTRAFLEFFGYTVGTQN